MFFPFSSLDSSVKCLCSSGYIKDTLLSLLFIHSFVLYKKKKIFFYFLFFIPIPVKSFSVEISCVPYGSFRGAVGRWGGGGESSTREPVGPPSTSRVGRVGYRCPSTTVDGRGLLHTSFESTWFRWSWCVRSKVGNVIPTPSIKTTLSVLVARVKVVKLSRRKTILFPTMSNSDKTIDVLSIDFLFLSFQPEDRFTLTSGLPKSRCLVGFFRFNYRVETRCSSPRDGSSKT